jgi:hypothetical protein
MLSFFFLEKRIYIYIPASASTDVYSYFLLQTTTLQPNARAATTYTHQNGLDMPRSTRTHRSIQLSLQQWRPSQIDRHGIPKWRLQRGTWRHRRHRCLTRRSRHYT